MLLRFNQVLFAAVVFAVKIGLLMACIYAALLSAGMVLFSAQHPDLGLVRVVSSYVALLCALSSFVAFSLAPLLKRQIKVTSNRIEGFWVVSLAALIANVTVIVSTRSILLYPFYILNIVVSVFGVFVGGPLYVSTLKKLERVKAEKIT